VNSARNHQMPLHMAAVKQHETVARLLVDFGADIYAENKSGLKPSALVPTHLPLYDFLCQCESTHQNFITFMYTDLCYCMDVVKTVIL